MRDLEKKRAAQRRYDRKRTSKIVSLSFRTSIEDEEEVRQLLKRLRVIVGGLRKVRSSSLKDELRRFVEDIEWIYPSPTDAPAKPKQDFALAKRIATALANHLNNAGSC